MSSCVLVPWQRGRLQPKVAVCHSFGLTALDRKSVSWLLHSIVHSGTQGGICRGKPGNFPLTGSDLPSHWFVSKLRGNGKGEGKGKGKGGGDHLPYSPPPPLASASNTTLVAPHV